MQSATQYTANSEPGYHNLGYPDPSSLGFDTDIPVPSLNELYTSSDHVWAGRLMGDLEYATLEALASGTMILPASPRVAIAPYAYLNYDVGQYPHATIRYACDGCIIH